MEIVYWVGGVTVGLFLMYKLGILSLLWDVVEAIFEIFTDIDL